MRILLVHNYYGSTAPSGENKVFEAEKTMLEKHGETVDVYTRHSDEIRVVVSGWWLVVRVKKIFNLIKGALCTVGNPFAARALRKKIKAFKPEVVHFHNQFPLISPLAIRAAHKAGCKVVMTLHNYRLVCAGGIPMRDGKVCRDCFKLCRGGELENWRRRQAEKKVECGNVNANMTEVTFEASSKRGQKKPPQLVSLTEAVRTVVSHQTATGTNPPNKDSIANRATVCKGERYGNLSVMPAVRHRCYRGSLLATLPLAINIWLYRHCWAKWVDRFIVLSEFQKAIMVECGLPEGKIVVKGNFVEKVKVAGEGRERKNQILFVGRLSDEKGVKTLIEAWKILSRVEMEKCGNETRLAIVGDGDQRDEYKKLASGLNIDFLEQKSHDEVMQLVAQSKCVVQPSVCWETFGMVVAEGMSAGTPAVVSNLGALPNLVGDAGIVVKAGDAEALAEGLRTMLSQSDFAAISAKCRSRAALFTEDANYCQLKTIYDNL